jgi:hypothetical protein
MSDCKTVYTPEIIVRQVDLYHFGGKTFFCIYCTVVKETDATISLI